MAASKVSNAIIFQQEDEQNYPKTVLKSNNPYSSEPAIKFQINLDNGPSRSKKIRKQSFKTNQLTVPQTKYNNQKKIKSHNDQSTDKSFQQQQNAYSARDTSVSKSPNTQKSLQLQQRQIDSAIQKAQRELQAASKLQTKSMRSKRGGISSQKQSNSSFNNLSGRTEVIKVTSVLHQKQPDIYMNNKSSNYFGYADLEEIQEEVEDVPDIKYSKIHRKKKQNTSNIPQKSPNAEDSSVVVLDRPQPQSQLSDFDAEDQVNLKQLREIQAAMTCPPPHRLWKCNFIIDRACCYPVFSLRRKNSSFLVNAKKQFLHLHSYYQITANENTFGSEVRSHLGYLRSNFVGSIFNLYEQKKGVPQLVCTIYYKPEISCFATFRNIEIYIKDHETSLSQLHGAEDKSLNLKDLYQHKQNADSKKIIRLINKKPQWNEQHQVYIMNLKGRGKVGSVKNMALIEEENPQKYIMLFCKSDKDAYHLEMVWPLSPFISLGILLSSFDFKLCCQ